MNSSTTVVNSTNSSNTANSNYNSNATLAVAVNSSQSSSTTINPIFAETVAKFKKDLKKRDQTAFQDATLEKLRQTVVDIQEKQYESITCEATQICAKSK
jgi:hypothetical protein